MNRSRTLLAPFIILLAVSFVPLAMAQATVLHLHDSKSLSGFAMDEIAPSSKDPTQQVAASCTFFGPAATSTSTLLPGTYAYVIFATGPEFSSNLATVTIEVYRSASNSLEPILGITPKTISGGGCPPSECIVKNEGSWAVSFEVVLGPSDRLALVITGTGGILRVLVDGSQDDPATKENVFTDSTLTTPGLLDPVGGYLMPVNKLEVLAPYLALLGVIATVAVLVAAPRKKTS